MFLNHLLELPIYYIGRACLLEDLSSRWAVPVYLMNCQVSKTGAEYMGRPIYSTTYRVDGTGPVYSPIRVSMSYGSRNNSKLAENRSKRRLTVTQGPTYCAGIKDSYCIYTGVIEHKISEHPLTRNIQIYTCFPQL